MSQDEETETEEAGGSSNGKRISPEVWEEIEELYETGQVKSVELSARYGVSTSTLSRRFQARKIVWNSRPISTAAATAVAHAAAAVAAAPKKTFAERRIERIEETKNRTYELHNALHILYGNMIREFGAKTAEPGDRAADIKALRLLGQGIEISRIGKYSLLDITPDPADFDHPTIVIDDLHDDEIAEMQRQQDEDGDMIVEEEVEIEETTE